MTSRKRSSSGFVQPQGRRSTRRRANAAPAESGANGDETPATAANSGGATAASTAVGGGEVRSKTLWRRNDAGHDDGPQAISATQASSAISAPTPALPAGLPHTGLSTSGPFVQYVPGSNRTRSGPPHVCTVCNKPFMRCVSSAYPLVKGTLDRIQANSPDPRPSTLATHMNIHSGATRTSYRRLVVNDAPC